MHSPSKVPPHAAVIVILAALLALGPITIDLYLPALPAMQHDLRASAAAVQLTITGATIGFGLGQLVVGPLSDSFGRRRPLLAAAVVHVIASIGVAIATDIAVTSPLRFVQGLGCTAASVVATSIVRDLYEGRRFLKAAADLGAVASFSPAAATLAGSLLLLAIDWRWLSIVVAAYGLLGAVVVAAVLPETLSRERRHPFRPVPLLRRYRDLLTDSRYVVATIISTACWSTHFAYLSASPFLLQQVHGLNVGQYGIAFAALTTVTVVSSQITSRKLIPRFGTTRMIPFLATGTALGVGSIVALALVLPRSLPGLFVPLIVVVASTAATMTSAGITAISGHRAQAGTAISLAGSVNFLAAGGVTALVGVLGVSSPLGMAGVMGGATVVVLLASVVLRRIGDPEELRVSTVRRSRSSSVSRGGGLGSRDPHRGRLGQEHP